MSLSCVVARAVELLEGMPPDAKNSGDVRDFVLLPMGLFDLYYYHFLIDVTGHVDAVG